MPPRRSFHRECLQDQLEPGLRLVGCRTLSACPRNAAAVLVFIALSPKLAASLPAAPSPRSAPERLGCGFRYHCMAGPSMPPALGSPRLQRRAVGFRGFLPFWPGSPFAGMGFRRCHADSPVRHPQQRPVPRALPREPRHLPLQLCDLVLWGAVRPDLTRLAAAHQPLERTRLRVGSSAAPTCQRQPLRSAGVRVPASTSRMTALMRRADALPPCTTGPIGPEPLLVLRLLGDRRLAHGSPPFFSASEDASAAGPRPGPTRPAPTTSAAPAAARPESRPRPMVWASSRAPHWPGGRRDDVHLLALSPSAVITTRHPRVQAERAAAGIPVC